MLSIMLNVYVLVRHFVLDTMAVVHVACSIRHVQLIFLSFVSFVQHELIFAARLTLTVLPTSHYSCWNVCK